MTAEDPLEREQGRGSSPSPAVPPRASAGAAVEQAADALESLKPKLRGWLHAGIFPASLVAGIVLIRLARSPQATLACGVFSISSWLLFGTSALYHRREWGRRGEAILRRLDHTNIFLMIAGTYTPLTVLLLPSQQCSVLLWWVWTGALAGIVFRIVWIGAPRWLYVLCYIVLGWAAVFYLPDFARTGGATVVILVVTGGLLYSVGAVAYALKHPDPSPRWFGFHEVFHAFTVTAFAAHYAAVLVAVR
ncbi:hemolysin III family protein [Streptomyces sp. NPDC053427]|uniref:PAQR family membrane homeostasis protein TrhA n=1 Tax=Streptomyces sp. NPDC053427 TaxID=3365701 RepID=UPI0037D968F3